MCALQLVAYIENTMDPYQTASNVTVFLSALNICIRHKKQATFSGTKNTGRIRVKGNLIVKNVRFSSHLNYHLISIIPSFIRILMVNGKRLKCSYFLKDIALVIFNLKPALSS